MKDIFMNIYLLSFFDWIIQTSIMASILVGLILCVKVLLRNKLTPRWDYLLWMILIVRLIFPWSPFDLYSIYSLLENSNNEIISIQSQPDISTENKLSQELRSPSTREFTEENLNETKTLQTSIDSKELNVVHQNKEPVESVSLYNIAYFIWLMGVIITTFITYILNRNLHKYIQKQPIISDQRIIKIFDRCKKEMSVKKNIPLLLSGKIASPTVLGFFHPKILLSNEYMHQLNDEQLRHIFYHELAHVKRSDVGINWIMHILLILNWFNPILWWAYICMREDQELACDAYALTFMDEDEKFSYGNTIISLLERYSNHYQAPSLANLSRNKRIIKRRILMIKKFGQKSYRWSAIGITALIAVASLSLLNAQAGTPSEKQLIRDKESLHNYKKASNDESESVYIPLKQEENYKDMSKIEILTKMINTVDNFETATGEYKIHYANIPSDSLVEYAISLKNKPGGFGKRTVLVNGSEEVTSEYFKDGSVWHLDEKTKTYVEEKYLEEDRKGTTLKNEDAFSVDSEGYNVTNYRERPPIGTANETLFPYEIASNYTRDLNNWEIEKQNEILVGHNTLVIKGNINRRDFQSFRFWVDKDTGILVKYETYNSDGDVVDYLYPTKLEINVPINSDKFTPNLEGYNMFRMEDQPFMTTGNIDQLIPEELKAQWEEAKKKPNETTILHFNDKWYISAKKGYLVDRIEVSGKQGTLFLAKTSPPKSEFTFHALAEGYGIENLKLAE